MKKRKILIVYSSGGGGLKHLAENLSRGFAKLYGKSIAVETVDPFAETKGVGELLFNKIYNFFLYHNLLVNSLLVDFSYATRPDRLPFVKWEAHRSLERKLQSADLVVSTSPWVLEGVFYSLEKTKRQVPVFVYIADFGEGMYSGWCHRKASSYFTVTDEAKSILLKLGAKPESIEVLGIPAKSPAKKSKVGHSGLKRILVASSMHGSGEIPRILDSINALQGKFDIDVLCGTGRNLLQKISRSTTGASKKSVQAHGFVSEEKVILLTNAADVLVTKAGALSIGKAVAASTPMILIGYPAVMPQEKGNAAFVVSRNIGWLCKSRNEIAGTIGRLASDPSLLSEKRKSIGSLRSFTDTKRICRAIMRRAGFTS